MAWVFALRELDVSSVLAILHAALVSGRDCIFADNFAIQPHCGSFTASSISKHFSRGLVRFCLGVMDAGRSIRLVQLVYPLTVFATVNRSIILICHNVFDCRV